MKPLSVAEEAFMGLPPAVANALGQTTAAATRHRHAPPSRLEPSRGRRLSLIDFIVSEANVERLRGCLGDGLPLRACLIVDSLGRSPSPMPSAKPLPWAKVHYDCAVYAGKLKKCVKAEARRSQASRISGEVGNSAMPAEVSSNQHPRI